MSEREHPTKVPLLTPFTVHEIGHEMAQKASDIPKASEGWGTRWWKKMTPSQKLFREERWAQVDALLEKHSLILQPAVAHAKRNNHRGLFYVFVIRPAASYGFRNIHRVPHVCVQPDSSLAYWKRAIEEVVKIQGVVCQLISK